MKNGIVVERLTPKNIPKVADIHRECFPTDTSDYDEAKKWIESNCNAHPRMVYYVSKFDEQIVGYILWMEKGGFRKDAVLELEQIGVSTPYRGRGIGERLIRESLRCYIESFLKPEDRNLKSVIVTTATTNEAQGLYKKALGAEVVAIIPDLYEGDEALMMSMGENLEEKILI